MSSKQEDPSEIPHILHDVKNNTKYQRQRFFGKVSAPFLLFLLLFNLPYWLLLLFPYALLRIGAIAVDFDWNDKKLPIWAEWQNIGLHIEAYKIIFILNTFYCVFISECACYDNIWCGINSLAAEIGCNLYLAELGNRKIWPKAKNLRLALTFKPKSKPIDT